jgi:hypothetical protein
MLLQDLYHKDKSNKDKHHGIFQAPIHHKPQSIPQNNGHPSHTATDKRPARKRSPRNQSSRSAMEGQQAIHEDIVGKSLSSKGKRATKPITNPPRGMPCHTISKGGCKNLMLTERGTPIPKPDSTSGHPWNNNAASRSIL